ncbi:hypothetical protein [Marinobacterium aestuariivivens]|uniref:REJ domain-containing protein n=1 Tax=Marinobacterium aestuariivivens TaxID=1698799 RepID=A0ABW1ZX86_9GAMM
MAPASPGLSASARASGRRASRIRFSVASSTSARAPSRHGSASISSSAISVSASAASGARYTWLVH